MQQKVIEVIDASIFKQELERGRVATDFIQSFLKNKKYVAKFLGVSETTITNMVSDGRLEEGKHYTIGNKIIFNPIAIIDYKLNPATKPKYQASLEARRFIC